MKKCITVYNFKNEGTLEYSFIGVVKADIYEDLYINFSDIAK